MIKMRTLHNPAGLPGYPEEYRKAMLDIRLHLQDTGNDELAARAKELNLFLTRLTIPVKDRKKFRAEELRTLFAAVYLELNISEASLKEQNRQRDIAEARFIFIAFWKTYLYPKMDNSTIAQLLGRPDHTFVSYCMRVSNEMYGSNLVFSAKMDKVKACYFELIK